MSDPDADLRAQVRDKALGLLARALQHEIDHLDGILAVQRAIDEKSFALRSQRVHLA